MVCTWKKNFAFGLVTAKRHTGFLYYYLSDMGTTPRAFTVYSDLRILFALFFNQTSVTTQKATEPLLDKGRTLYADNLYI